MRQKQKKEDEEKHENMMGKIWQKFAAHKGKMCKYIYIR